MEAVTEVIVKVNDVLVMVSLISTIYWAGFVGRNRDERGYKIIGKSSILSFSIAIFCVAFSLLFNISGQIQDAHLSEYLLFTYTLTMTVFALSLFIYNRSGTIG